VRRASRSNRPTNYRYACAGLEPGIWIVDRAGGARGAGADGAGIADLEVIELNEAFAAQALGVIRTLDLLRNAPIRTGEGWSGARDRGDGGGVDGEGGARTAAQWWRYGL